MLLLIAIAFVAGAGTALTPCVLPVLPALLSAGATGGRRRPLGIVIGLTATFTLVVGGLASVVGLTSGVVRGIAIAALLAFGATLLIPALGARVEARLSRIGWLAPSSAGDGFWSGLGVGGALGLVYTPCAGPILAAVISVAARHHTSLKTLEIALAYGLGSAVVLLALALGGRRVVARIRAAGRGERLQRVLGAVIVASAVLIATNLDLRFESSLARNLPAVFSNPTSALERAGGVERRLTKLRGRARFRPHGGRSRRAAPGRPGAPAASLENLGVAPDFTATQRWFNTGGRALSLGSLRGRVVLVDFWTYTCINCLRTLPFLKTLDARYRAAGLTVVGVHTPEFDFEHEAGNVAAAIRREGIRYPVVQDNNYATWNAYGNQYWPAEYLIDAAGNVRHVHFGEGEYAKSEAAVRALLAERGVRRLGLPSGAHGTSVSTRAATPETYLGAKKATGFVGDAPRLGTHTYRELRAKLPTNAFALGGSWRIGADQATAASGASIDVAFQARKVFLVLSATAGGGDVKVLLDRRRIAAAERGSDVARGRVHVRGQRLYELVSLPRVERRRLTLRLRPGVSAYAFTFG